jgi:hypothetical protein
MNQRSAHFYKMYILFLVFPIKLPSQTTIIVVRTSYGIYVGSDTKRGTTLYDPNTKSIISQRADTICKIGKYHSIFYAVAGAKPEEVRTEIERSIHPHMSYEGILSKVIQNVSSQRLQYLKELQKNHRSIFESRFEDIRSLEVALFGYQNKIPKTVRIVFSIVTLKSRPVQLTATVANKHFDKPAFPNEFIPFPMGHANEIKNLLIKPEFWMNKYPAKAIEELILIEARAHPESVSAPVDLLFLNEKGFKWLQGPSKPAF